MKMKIAALYISLLGSLSILTEAGFIIEADLKEDISNSLGTIQYEQVETYIRLGRGTHGGWGCGACTVLVGMGVQLADINNETVAEGLERLCSYLPSPMSRECSILIYTLGPAIMEYLTDTSSPDLVCYTIGLCTAEPDQCHLFPKHSPDVYRTDYTQKQKGEKIQLKQRNKQQKNEFLFNSSLRGKTFRLSEAGRLRLEDSLVRVFPWLCFIPGVKQLCDALDKAFNQLLPSVDIDGDGHSPAETFRGSLWRGRDCHDADPQVHPGRRPIDEDRHHDSNCNGIWGVNGSSGLAWEEELCTGSDQKGLIFLGDSVTAHFHIPPEWFNPMLMSSGLFSNITDVITNEADWPDVGFATGFRNTSMPALIQGKVDSIYLRLRERNLCNHRDYNNLARNGANSTDTLSYVKSLTRGKRDLPALVFYSLIANDVCTEKVDPSRMTTVEKFRSNTVQVLSILDSQLAPGSHVVLVGLIDAGFLYETMAERYHPLGQYRKNIKYKDMYNWFNCMEIGPCAGWMNQNTTLREITSQRSRDLSQVLSAVAREEKFSNFDVNFISNPFQAVINNWVQGGGKLHQLIEPVDSLHPTQTAQSLIAAEIWSRLEAELPHVLGPINPRNEDIQRLFGDQGGH